MKKLYYAYVTMDMVGYFEDKLAERDGKIEVVRTSPAISKNGEPLVYYVLEAESGVINSKWELINQKGA